MKPFTIIVLLVTLVALILIKTSLFTVREGEQAVVLQFGEPVREVTEAGLNFKTPFIQTVNRLEKRQLPWDGAPEPMTTKDKKMIYIDVWARWRIVEPTLFFKRARTINRGNKILDDLVDGTVRDVVARNLLIEVVRSSNRELQYESDELAETAHAKRATIEVGRSAMEAQILQEAGASLQKDYGMELTDVHIKRVNYEETVRNTVYDRMKSERMRIAKLLDSEAKEEENRILGQTQKLHEQIIGEMEQKSAEIRGQADAEVIRIAAEAYSRSPEFYEFLRRLEAYKKTLAQNTRLVLSTDNEFLRPFRNPHAAPAE
jgi:membrane protease subunit HflC